MNNHLIAGLLTLLILTGSIFSCTPTKKAFEHGDYDTAVFNSVKRLRKSPNNKKSRETLLSAYPLMVDYHLDRISQEKASNNPHKWENIMNHYAVLQRAYDEVQRAPAARDLLPGVRSFNQQLVASQSAAARERYELGKTDLDRAIDLNDREYAKSAYNHFLVTRDLQPGFRDTEELMTRAFDLATLVVLVQPIPMHSQTLSLSNEFFDNQINEFIRAYKRSPFVRFITPEEQLENGRRPDQVIEMIFDDFVVGQTVLKENVVQRQRDSVVISEIEVSKDSVQLVYGTVKAKVFRFEKQITSSGLLDLKIIDVYSNSVISQQKFPGTFIYYDYWGYFNGDERAIEEDDRQYITKNRPAPNPSPQILFREFTQPIFEQVTGFISDFYRGA